MDNAAAIRVLLVEDNDVFREALELMLGVMPDIAVVGSVGDGHAAVAACARLRPDVVLMDYRLPGLDGVEATAAIHASSDAAVVALTATADVQELDEIVAAIRDAATRGASLV